MNLKTLATAVCFSLMTATASFAAPIDFNFSFTRNTTPFPVGTRTITGLIEGLDSDGLGQQATRISVFGGVYGDYAATAFTRNSFNVTAGVIDAASVGLSAFTNGAMAPLGASISFDGPSSTFQLQEFSSFPGFGVITTTAASEITFMSDSTALVPLPAGGLLLLSGMVGVAGLKRRKKRAA